MRRSARDISVSRSYVRERRCCSALSRQGPSRKASWTSVTVPARTSAIRRSRSSLRTMMRASIWASKSASSRADAASSCAWPSSASPSWAWRWASMMARCLSACFWRYALRAAGSMVIFLGGAFFLTLNS